MSDFIMQMRPLFEEEEKKAVCEYMDEDGFITEFKRTEKFEQMIAEYTGAKHCVVVNNGTISLSLAAMAVGVEAGDEVIVPNYTMIATPNSLKMFGANPVFVDVEPDTLCLDFDLTKKAITPKTKAIMLVTANGRYPQSGIKTFEDLCTKQNLILIEDSAQSLGSFYPDGRHIGTVGLAGSFSFSAPKIISTGQGGAIVTNDFWYFEIDEAVIKKELFLELTSTSWFDDICKRGSDGTTQRIRLQKDKFFSQEINLPLPDEQEKLLLKLKIIKQDQTLLRHQIVAQQEMVTNLKQSILQEAIQGKLTEDWRKENPDVEPASELLKRIRAEKEQLVKDKKIIPVAIGTHDEVYKG